MNWEAIGAYIRNVSVAHDPKDVAGTMGMLDEILGQRGIREWLETSSPDWRTEFREFVDLRLEAIKQEE